MEHRAEHIAGYSLERIERLAGGEIWHIHTSKDWETIGQAFVIYPDYDVCQIMLGIENEHMGESDDLLELLLETLGVEEFVCSLNEWKEDIYYDDGEEEFEEETID